ncbi:hypothetical protein ADUPG1_013955 [Aduncisulcus paluster]|uniref:Uncharacterized protein n=2 Tax=Aduncisulcus paluster TaxID=2918883 RepID=A0ABQ5K507_9EUKA|nr:hypothetical protein ADUPG1_013955 [Aduncisulcus paluster]
MFSKISRLPEDNIPNKTICSELWPFCPPIFDIVKKEMVKKKIIKKEYWFVIRLFSNLCIDPAHAHEVHEQVKDLLDGWYEAIMKKKHRLGIRFWSELISMLSVVPSIGPHISPKYDSAMEWWKENGALSDDSSRYKKYSVTKVTCYF